MRRNKALLRLGNTTFVERAASALGAVAGGDIGIVGELGGRYSAPLAVADQPGRTLRQIPDIVIRHEIRKNKAGSGALVGLYTALADATTPWIVVLACDLPFVTEDLMTRLAGYCSNEFEAIVPEQQDAKPQPLCAFYAREKCLPVVEAMIKNGDLKMQRLLSRINTRFVGFAEIVDLDSSSDFFLNVNTSEDYETALKIAAG